MQKGLMEMTGWRNNENTDGGIGRKDGGIGSRLIEEFGWRYRQQADRLDWMDG